MAGPSRIITLRNACGISPRFPSTIRDLGSIMRLENAVHTSSNTSAGVLVGGYIKNCTSLVDYFQLILTIYKILMLHVVG